MKVSHCKGCGRPIVWITSQSKAGKVVRVPLDADPVAGPADIAYHITHADSIGAIGERVGPVHRSHFQSCPKAHKFSGRGRT